MDAGAGARGVELRLLHEINAGTFARLYLAEISGAAGLDRIVAVKLLREQWNEQQDIVARTRDEARLLARLRHKNILRVEDLVEVDGQTAIIMEYVDGLDLKQLVDGLRDRRQRVPAKVALQVALQAASALEAAYFRVPTGMDQPLRVVHRDVKPSNIMLSVEGEVRVLDFGTARSNHISRSAQTVAMRFGSPKYMSPERKEGDRGEHAGDIYALGLVLLELLRTDWLPMLPMDVGEHDEAITQAIARLDQLGMPNSEWDMTLRQVLGQMLASEPSVRPTAEQLVKLLRAFVEQASGPMLDRFAHETVLPLTRELREPTGGGALAGRRLLVQALGEANRGGSGPHPTPQPSRTADPQGRSGGNAPAPRASSPAPTPQPRASNPRSAPVPAPPEVEGGGNTALAVGAGLFVLVGVGLVVVVLLGGLGWYFWGRGDVASPPPVVVSADPSTGTTGGSSAGGGTTAGGGTAGTTTGVSADPGGTPGASRSGAPVLVTTGGEPTQWVHLESGGSTVAEGRGKLDASAPPGDYELAVKLVGREVLRGSISVPEAGVKLDCTTDAHKNLKCTSGKRTYTLKP